MSLLASLALKGNQVPAAITRGRDVSVMAGAGSGKTWTLVGRYLSLLDDGLHPRAVVAITFTDKAAREMRNRIRKSIHEWVTGNCPPAERARWEDIEADMDTARIGTIHGLCASILRAHPAEAHVDPRFEVLDEGLAAALQAQVVDDTLAWALNQTNLTPLFQSFETEQLNEILNALLRNRLQVPAPASSDILLSTWQHAIANAIRRFTCDSAVVGAMNELAALAGSGDLADDAGDKLAAQVDGLLAAWHVIGAKLTQGNAVTAAGALYTVRREYCDGRPGKRTSRAKAAVASLKSEYDEQVQPWLGGKAEKDPEPDGEREARAVELVPLLAQTYQHTLESYQSAKDIRQALDFDDLEQGALDLLRQPGIRRRWQAQFQALLVDEFQDTNERQRQIVEFLAGTTDGRTGRLFIVGDAKQSIYRFRGADVTVFRRLDDDIQKRGGLPLVLDVTYRGHAALVEALNEILATVMAPPEDALSFVVPFAPLKADRPTPETRASAPYIEFLHGLGTSADESKKSAARLLAERLTELNRDDAIPWDQMALLFRASTGFPEYEAALEEWGIPFVTVAGRGFYDRPEIRDLLNILRALADPWDDLAMAGLLRSPAFGLSDVDLYRLRWSKGAAPSGFLTALSGDLAFLSEKDQARAQRALEIVKGLSGLVGRVSMAELLKRVLDETRYPALLGAERAGARLQRNVSKLLADAHASGLVGVTEFLEYIETLHDVGAREGEAPAEAGGALRLMTVHKAKGLEFPIVVLADAAHGRPPFKDPVVLSPELGVVPNPGRWDDRPISFQLAKALDGERDDAEDVRLLYVAATRAKDKLIICGHQPRVRNTWLNRLSDAAGVSLAQLAAMPGEWQTITLPQSNQTVRGMARTAEPGGGDARPPVRTEQAASSQLISLCASLMTQDVEVPDQKGPGDARIAQRLRRVTGRRQRADGTLVGTLVHTALAQWRFPSNPALHGLLLTAVLEQGVVQPDEQDLAMSEAKELLRRLQANPRWQEINCSPVRRHEVPYAYPIASGITTGYVDLLYRDARSCWKIVDFKTDAIGSEEEMGMLIAAQYGKQIRRYREAVERLLGESPEPWLCFLDFRGEVRWARVS